MKKNKVPLIYYGVLKNKRSEKKEIGKKWRRTFLNIFKNFAKAIIPPAILLFITIGVPITSFNVSLAMTGFGAFYLAYVGYETINTFDNKNNKSIFAVQNIFRNLHDAFEDIGNLFVLSYLYLKKDSEISKISNGLDETIKQREQEKITTNEETETEEMQKPLEKFRFLYEETKKLPYELKCSYVDELTTLFIKYRDENKITLTTEEYNLLVFNTNLALSDIEARIQSDIEKNINADKFHLGNMDEIIQNIRSEDQAVLGRKKH